jgi:oligopeptide/dipeptide ABC transporter ATP-binding protein
MSVSDPGGRTPVLEVEDLHINLRARAGSVPIVRGVSFVLYPGQRIAILGESGAGKSVTARCIAGILAEDRFQVSGSVRVDGIEFAGRSRNELRPHRGKVSLVFQDPTRTLNPSMRIGRQIVEALLHAGVSKQQAHEEAVRLMGRVGIADPEQRYFSYPHQLSGGMRQRIVIAIALALKPDILVADEATTSLDVTMQAQIMKLLRSLTEEDGMAMILITHDVALAASAVDDVMVMYAGRFVESIPAQGIAVSSAMPYTRALIAAVPGMQTGTRLPDPIPGTPPDPANPPGGCPFHPRCAVSISACTGAEPPYLQIAESHYCACWLTTNSSVGSVKE